MKIEIQIVRFKQSIEEFVDCVAALNSELFLKRFNHWSPRDVVAHLIGWNRYIIEGSKQIIREELPFYDIDPGEDYSKVNAVLVLEYSSRDRQEMLDELRASAQDLMRFIGSLDPGDWSQDFGVRHKGAIVTIKDTIDEFIEDYDIHKERLKEWSKSQKG